MANLLYLRASTDEKDASRAQDMMLEWLGERGQQADHIYLENYTGTKVERPELNRLLADAQRDDFLIVEQVDRLTRLSAEDWKKLKHLVDERGLNIVALDLPTSWQLYDESITGQIMKALNSFMMDLLAITARKDYEDRRRRQAQGIEKAKAQGKYKGKQQSETTIKKCKAALLLVQSGESKESAAKTVGVGIATLYRYIKEQAK
ncbi:recombinase family protein [Vibrio rotiferianus]|uniref:recombinase family protein n=1 Tax=Vibrio rotiferianus TaxID=190895 RepID=UPI00023771E0|nr:recombinase family protein [Vibrio rotiferianus]